MTTELEARLKGLEARLKELEDQMALLHLQSRKPSRVVHEVVHFNGDEL